MADQDQKINEINELLEKIYYDPSSPGSFGGIDKLLREANRLYLLTHTKKISRHVVRKYLSTQDAYTLIRPARKRFPKNPYLIKYKGYQFASDLMILDQFGEENDGYKVLLIVMDLYSRYVFVRALKDKSARSVLNGLMSIFDESGIFPEKFETDSGTEYFNRLVGTFLKSKKIHHFTKGKAVHIERWIRTFGTTIYRYQTKHNTRRYFDALPDLVKSYNNTLHRSIKTTPYSVFIENRPIQDESQRKIIKKKTNDIKVGDLVRLSRDPVTGNIFEKESYGRWTGEIFIVKKIIEKPGAKTVYSLVDQAQEPVKVNFYREEIQKIITDLGQRLFEIDQVIKYRTHKGEKQGLVLWKNYPKSFASWEPLSNIQDI
jgi:Integrase core domain/Chromo (CHRromatin Organisation MOdifier) domain